MSVMQNPDTAMAAPSMGIDASLDRLNSLIDDVDRSYVTLYARLNRAMRPVPTLSDESPCKSTQTKLQSPLAEIIDEYSDKLEVVLRLITQAINRVEL